MSQWYHQSDQDTETSHLWYLVGSVELARPFPPTDTVVPNQHRPLLSWINTHREGGRNNLSVKISPHGGAQWMKLSLSFVYSQK